MTRVTCVVLAACAILPATASRVALRSGDPALDGKDYLLSEADFRALLGVARVHLTTFRPRPSIYRVTVISATEVHAWYHVSPHSDDEYVDWLVIERLKKQWRVTSKGGYQFTDLTNRSSQPLAVPMSSFHMTSTFNSVAKLAAASGG